MPDLCSSLGKQHEIALSEARQYLRKYGHKEPEELTKTYLKRYSRWHAIKGWKIFPLCMQESMYDLNIFFDNEFPYSLPKAAITPIPKFLKYPHIEEDGYLCLERLTPDETNIEETIDDVVLSSLNLIYNCLNYKNKNDFQDEAITYWERKADIKQYNFLSLLDTTNKKSRIVVASKKYKIIAEDKKTIRHWLANSKKKKSRFCSALFLWPKNIFPSPDKYPENIMDVYDYIEDNVDAAIVNKFELIMTSFANPVLIVLGFDTRDGVTMLGILIDGASKRNLLFGFRLGRMPMDLFLERGYLDKNQSTKINVKRVDPEWSLFRDNNQKLSNLRDKKVTIVGCGSVGSTVARLLVQSGIRQLTLIDHDHLEWDNIGRHVLGAKSLGVSKNVKKVRLLRESLCQDFPHLIVKTFSKKWERIKIGRGRLLNETDLIIMATGDWGAEAAMNQAMIGEEKFPPIIYGWAEAFACAGHSLAIFKNSGCLECFFQQRKFKFSLSEFEKEEFEVPGCTDTFNPFGNIELTPICSMIAEMSVDILSNKITESQLISWIGAKDKVVERNGEWTTRAETLFHENNNDYGYFRDVLKLNDIKHCYSCSVSMEG